MFKTKMYLCITICVKEIRVREMIWIHMIEEHSVEPNNLSTFWKYTILLLITYFLLPVMLKWNSEWQLLCWISRFTDARFWILFTFQYIWFVVNTSLSNLRMNVLNKGDTIHCISLNDVWVIISVIISL